MYIFTYIVALIVFICGDLLWLGVVARNFYQSGLNHLLGPVNWYAAIIFYLVFVGGLMYFAILPAINSGQFGKAILLGALFGFFTYATYDLTNHATLKDWPLMVTVVDILWGVFLGALVSGATFLIHKNFLA